MASTTNNGNYSTSVFEDDDTAQEQTQNTQGLFKDEQDWHKFTDLALKILKHQHSHRCEIKASSKDDPDPDNIKCKKVDQKKDSKKPLTKAQIIVMFTCTRRSKDTFICTP